MEKGLYELGRDRRQLRNTLKESGFSVSKEEGVKELKEAINKETNKFKKIKLESLLRLWNDTQDNINTNVKEITKTNKDNPWRELRAEYKRQKSEGKIGHISQQFNGPEKFQEIARLSIELEECEKAILEAEYLMKENNLLAESLLDEFQKNKAQIQKELDELKEKNPTEYESYKIYSYHQDLKKEGHIARVESVREYLQKITDCIIEGKPMFLFGPTGTGKTSLARFAAKQLTGQSPEMIYCSPQTRESNIFGTKSLESKDGNTITSFDYGPLSKSAKEGRVLILDEFTSLPKEIMSIFKGIMNAKVGDEINIPGDGKVKIKQGFQIIFTANLKSDKNKERSDLPPEFANEVLFNNLKIKYPNQKESKEIFIARLLDQNMTTNFSMYDIEETLPKLLKAIEEIQELYEGIENKELKDKLEADPVKRDRLELKKLVLNQRSIENILGKWKLELRRNPNLSFVEFLDKSLATALNFDELKEDKLLVIKIFIKNGLLSTIDAKDLRLNEKDLNVFARSEMLKEREQTISKSKDRKILTLRDILGKEEVYQKGEKSIEDLKEVFDVTSTGNTIEKKTLKEWDDFYSESFADWYRFQGKINKDTPSQILEGHTDWVRTLQVLPDGKIVSGSTDNTIIIWNEDGTKDKTLKGHTGWVWTLQVLPDGKIVSGSNDNTIIIWNEDGTKDKTLEGHKGWVNTLQVLPDGRIVSGSDDNTIIIWNEDGTKDKTLEGHKGWVNTLQVLPDGRIVSGSDDNTIIIWNEDGTKDKTLKGHTGSVLTLQVLPDGKIVSGSNDNTIIIWNEDGTKDKTLKGHTGSVLTLQVLPDGKIVSGSADNTIIIWNEDGTKDKTLVGHTGAVNTLQVLPDGRIVSGSKDKTIIIWDIDRDDGRYYFINKDGVRVYSEN